ncbi:hypothetical protein [Limnobaculum xujianqingii]|uniref:hypothetical protein n=1 Tax=Limnobaculum xujianqingii TaxID=2738837 RepID=UPI001129E60B|nr:hypothetical protein [Limnobaculum xujianqingii]
MNKIPCTFLLLATLTYTGIVAATDIVKPLNIPEAREKAELTVNTLMSLEKKFMANVQAGMSAQQMKQEISQPLFTLLEQWPHSYVDDGDAQAHFLSCRDSISNLQSVVSSVVKPMSKNKETNKKSFNVALERYEESGQVCQKMLNMTDKELAAIDKQKREAKCTKKSVIFDVDKGEMVEQPKPAYCTKS